MLDNILESDSTRVRYEANAARNSRQRPEHGAQSMTAGDPRSD
jgi:hypothetical protein